MAPNPLCVDLDRTLIKEDILIEDLLKVVLKKPQKLPFAFLWLLFGKSFLKYNLAKIYPPDPARLTYNESVINLVKLRHCKKGKVYLATASTKSRAESIANFLGIFDGVFASDKNINLKSKKKAEVLSNSFGYKRFDYVGDSRSDFPVWRCCDQAFILGDNPSLLCRIQKINLSVISLEKMSS